MRKGIVVVAALLVGSAFGAAARGVVGEAHASPSGRLEYKVVGPSVLTGGYEQDLNTLAAEGWHYAGSIPVVKFNSFIVLERSH
jgi:hypothetical protein